MFNKLVTPLFFLLLIGSFATTNFAQEVTIFGTVLDVNTYKKVRHVNIYVEDLNIGTTSDYAGRFVLKVIKPNPGTVVVFQHIAYEPLTIRLDSVRTMNKIYLQPRVIPLQGVEIERGSISSIEIKKDLPQTLSLIEAKDFEIRGYVDAGDLLRTEHSVQVNELISGKKTVSIRGGNSDEVVVLYNGVKMNSAYDNVFDLSLIDLEDIERFEIIKGSNTALYGPEALSGVINIVPKTQQDYNVRFQQRLGTYRSGNWGLHLHKELNRLQGTYSLKRGSTTRNFTDVPEDQRLLRNTFLHHTANLNYSFSNAPDKIDKNMLNAMYIYTALDYNNQRDADTLSNFNQLLSLKYSGDIFKLRDLNLSVSLRMLDEEQFLATSTGSVNRDIKDEALLVFVEKRLEFERFELLLGYQFQRSELDFEDIRQNFNEQAVGLESAILERTHHGLVSIVKYHGETDSDFLQSVDLNFSLRYDRIGDDQSDPLLRSDGTTSAQNSSVGVFNKNNWDATMVKFAVNTPGYRKDFFLNAYFNYGSNAKFPTLLQQVSSPALFFRSATRPNLSPEKSSSLELGLVLKKDIRDDKSFYGWEISGNYFRTLYENKFRVFNTPGVPVSFYDNVQDARISGLESKSSVFLFKKKVTLALGLSRYFISEPAAFPFKSDFKQTLSLIIDHAGYSFETFWFKEGEQTALLRQLKSQGQQTGFTQVTLPDYMNLDLHLSKAFEIGNYRLFANLSGRNLLNDDDVELEGIAIRDRRFYITVGAQY